MSIRANAPLGPTPVALDHLLTAAAAVALGLGQPGALAVLDAGALCRWQHRCPLSLPVLHAQKTSGTHTFFLHLRCVAPKSGELDGQDGGDNQPDERQQDVQTSERGGEPVVIHASAPSWW